MTDHEARDAQDLSGEVQRLGATLQRLLREAWDSEERRRAQSEIEAGLHELLAGLKGAAEQFGASPAGQQLRQELRDLQRRAESGELEAKARQELLRLVRRVNEELERLGGAAADGPRSPG
jgi:hypothetical protein